MAKKLYVLATEKAWIKEWLSNGTWSMDRMTSVIIRRDNGKLIQIFGSGSYGDYGKEGQAVHLMSSTTLRHLDYGTIVEYYNDGIYKGASTYVFK